MAGVVAVQGVAIHVARALGILVVGDHEATLLLLGQLHHSLVREHRASHQRPGAAKLVREHLAGLDGVTSRSVLNGFTGAVPIFIEASRAQHVSPIGDVRANGFRGATLGTHAEFTRKNGGTAAGRLDYDFGHRSGAVCVRSGSGDQRTRQNHRIPWLVEGTLKTSVFGSKGVLGIPGIVVLLQSFGTDGLRGLGVLGGSLLLHSLQNPRASGIVDGNVVSFGAEVLCRSDDSQGQKKKSKSGDHLGKLPVGE
mmetsp:Transcript_27912/g.63192  ORF Transcript_27912/g.63192 Transcript_27912/m.63192 type:complete len:253 (-) Transcript_27912:51-809(-)